MKSFEIFWERGDETMSETIEARSLESAARRAHAMVAPLDGFRFVSVVELSK